MDETIISFYQKNYIWNIWGMIAADYRIKRFEIEYPDLKKYKKMYKSSEEAQWNRHWEAAMQWKKGIDPREILN